MKRRQFLGVSGAVTTGVLGGKSVSFVRRNVGIGTATAASVDDVPPRATQVEGRVTDVDGSTLSVELSPTTAVEPVRLVAARRGYPDGDVVSQVRSDQVVFANPGATETVALEVPYEGYESGRWFYEVYAVDDESLAFVCESAPYRWRQRPEYGADTADRTTKGPDPVDGDGFGRRVAGNDYRLRYRWHDSANRNWQLRYSLRRSVHEAAVTRERGYVRTFEESQSNPYARDLVSALRTDAVVENTDDETVSSAAELTDGEWFDLVVRFVQELRYARDFETTDQYDYNRTVEETLVAGVGDCKDKTHLLAGLLSASPLNCDTAMLFQPAHVLLGVAADDVPARYDDRERLELGGRAYVPIDGSLRFDVGDYPDWPITAAYGDDDWIHYDVSAIGDGLDRNVSDWLEQNVSS